MARLLMLFSVFVICFIPAAFSQDKEEITFTTYYPSPYGSYVEMHGNKIAVGSGYQATTPPDNSLIVEGSVNIGTPNPIGSNKLTVAGDGQFSGVVSANGAKGAGVYVSVPFSELNKYHSWCPAGGTPPGGTMTSDERWGCVAACNRKCSTGSGSAFPGLGYHGGTAVEWATTLAVGCLCS
ncbi:MAG: hypothetical protein NT060_02180 [Candidatus Omnitrophica bacterium]|nr:hypothetical protein [Candidatus Omnitrophota bacterium]